MTARPRSQLQEKNKTTILLGKAKVSHHIIIIIIKLYTRYLQKQKEKEATHC